MTHEALSVDVSSNPELLSLAQEVKQSGQPRVLRTDRTERIVRLLVGSDADAVAAQLTAAGASGVRVVDLNLEDIFLYAVSQ